MRTKGDRKQKQQKVHRHKWNDHCDCEYCELEECLKCGEQRTKKIYKKSL